MQISATRLGQKFRLSGEEMNLVLAKLGYLVGTPGDYNLTEKAREYAVEKHFHRGTGGYSCYNRYWTTRTYDDSITDVLDISPNLIKEVRDELSKVRAARYAELVAARVKVKTEYLEKQAAQKFAGELAEKAAIETEERVTKWKKAGTIGLVVVGCIVIGYGIYKTTPRIKKWWKERKQPPQERIA